MLTPGPVLVEVAVDSAAAAVGAVAVGAGRLELCQSLELGGLTPSEGLLRHVRASVAVPVVVMIRPRPGDFQASADDLDVMLHDVTAAVAAGADGVAAGVLRGDGTIDDGALARLIEAAAPAPLTFHRAFDLIDDQLAALSLLERLGVRRVLTSGAAATAWEGRHRLAALAAAAGPSLTLLPGGGIQADHVLELIRIAGATEIHLSGVKFTGDGGPFGFGRAGRPDVERVAAVVAAVRG